MSTVCGNGAPAALDALAATCLALGVDERDLSVDEKRLLPPTGTPLLGDVDVLREEILRGGDPLGDAFCAILSPDDRRPKGQTFTPKIIVDSMLDWASTQIDPDRIVDPGVGSGRYVVSALRAFPKAAGIATDIDPYSTLMTRANASVTGVADRLIVLLGDYRSLELPEIEGKTLFIGNPPYVRHHDISAEWKAWLTNEAAKLGAKASKLAGLHAHFFLATALYSRPGDAGAFITSSEWLDVNYGQLIRDLLLQHLSLSSLHIINPETSPFEGTAVTGTITCFKVGADEPSVRIQNVDHLQELGCLASGFELSKERLQESTRWSLLTRAKRDVPEGFVELGEIARVHRGAVTGSNKTWVVKRGGSKLPESVLFPSVTRAAELFSAGETLAIGDVHKEVIDLPADLDELDDEDRKVVDRFLRKAKRDGVHEGYVARARQRWWRVGLKDPAPILATYMARRPPTFVRNSDSLRHINIAHGVYPRENMGNIELERLASFLRENVAVSNGRTYAGGLTKFEPREMERLVVPSLAMLRDGNWDVASIAAEMDGGGISGRR